MKSISTISILFLIIIMQWACHSTHHFVKIIPKVQQTSLPESCAGILDLVDGNVFFNTKDEYYVFNRPFTNSIKEYEELCLSSLTKPQIKQLLGVPSFESNSEMCYLVTNDLSELPRSLQYYTMHISFLKNGQVKIGLDACEEWSIQQKK